MKRILQILSIVLFAATMLFSGFDAAIAQTYDWSNVDQDGLEVIKNSLSLAGRRLQERGDEISPTNLASEANLVLAESNYGEYLEPMQSLLNTYTQRQLIVPGEDINIQQMNQFLQQDFDSFKNPGEVEAPETVLDAEGRSEVVGIADPLRISPEGVTKGSDVIGVVSARLGRLLNTMFGLIGVLAIVPIVFGGLQLITSQGSQEKVAKGKKALFWGVVGVVIAFSGLVFFNFLLQVLVQQ